MQHKKNHKTVSTLILIQQIIICISIILEVHINYRQLELIRNYQMDNIIIDMSHDGVYIYLADSGILNLQKPHYRLL